MRLDAADAVRFARDHGLVSGATARASALSGGVSNDTLLVDDGSRRAVVKRALGRLRTAAEWYASPDRALDEAAALRLAATVTPGRVPPVLAADPISATIALAVAPAGWRDWKVELLAGRVRPAVGATLGSVLGAWHGTTHDAPELLGGLDGMDRMEALRIAPFHEVVAGRHADLAGLIGEAAAQLRDIRLCFVHGDLSPKNVLVPAAPARPVRVPAGVVRVSPQGSPGQRLVRPDKSQGSLWVIDFEVAHLGNPVFDLAFMHAHLLLKAIAAQLSGLTGRWPAGTARPALTGVAKGLRETATAFADAYRDALAKSSLDADAVCAELALHTGCLVLARVDGTSVVDYLDGGAARRARRMGRWLIAGVIGLGEAWDEVAADA